MKIKLLKPTLIDKHNFDAGQVADVDDQRGKSLVAADAAEEYKPSGLILPDSAPPAEPESTQLPGEVPTKREAVVIPSAKNATKIP